MSKEKVKRIRVRRRSEQLTKSKPDPSILPLPETLPEIYEEEADNTDATTNSPISEAVAALNAFLAMAVPPRRPHVSPTTTPTVSPPSMELRFEQDAHRAALVVHLRIGRYSGCVEVPDESRYRARGEEGLEEEVTRAIDQLLQMYVEDALRPEAMRLVQRMVNERGG